MIVPAVAATLQIAGSVGTPLALSARDLVVRLPK
jgi:hypothetical protein